MSAATTLWLGIAGDLLLCLLLVRLLWGPIGASLSRRLGFPGVADSLPVSVALGMGAWGMVVLALGMCGLIRPWVFVSLTVAAAVTLRFVRHRPEIRSERLGFGLWETLPFLFASPLVVLTLGSALAPELAFDAINVHLPYARQSVESGRISFAPNNWSSVMPALPLMSYVTGFALAGVRLVKLSNWVNLALTGGVIFVFARLRMSSPAAAAAAAMFLVSPVALYEATTTMIDLPLTLFSAVAVLSLLEWALGRQRAWLDLSALALGLALGCKYHAAFWVAPFAAVIAWRIRPESAAAVLRTLVRYGLIALLPVLPWLARAAWYSGNPVFPLANGLFHSPYFTPAMEEAARAAYDNEGVGRSVKALLMLPWTATVHPGPFRGTLGWVFSAGVLLSLFGLKRPVVRICLFVAALYFCAWALTAQEIRYLLPLAPLLAVLTAASVPGALRDDDTSGERDVRPAASRRAAPFVLAALTATFAVTSWPSAYERVYREWTYWHSWKSPFAYLLGRESAQEYLKRDVPSIFVYDYVNANLGPRDRILLLNDAAQFYSRVPTLYSFTVEGERILLETSEDGVARRLAESGVTHILLNYNGLAPLPKVVPRRGAYIFLSPAFQAARLERVFEANNVVLFRVRAS